MRNCFFYYIYFLCKLQYNFHVIHFFVKITNHCLVLFVIFHIKHQSFPLRELSSSGYSQLKQEKSQIYLNMNTAQQFVYIILLDMLIMLVQCLVCQIGILIADRVQNLGVFL